MKLKSAVFVNALKVAFSQLELTMSAVDYHKMVAKFEPGKFIDLLQTSGEDGSSGFVAAIFRTLTDDADAVDVATRAFTKALQDTGHVEDTTSLLSNKSAFDVASVTDVFARSIGYVRPFLDTATVQEITAVELQRPLGNSLSITDEILAYISGKGYFETSVATDAINSLAITKLFLDAATFSDFVVLVLSRARVFAENLAFTDDNFFNFGKRLSDTASATDAGSLRSHNYSDFTYFSEDFVGASRTFT